MKILETTWRGIRPLLMHSADMIDPLNPIVMRINELRKKGSKNTTDADLEELHRLEWEGNGYWSDEIGFYVPAENLEKCIKEGGAKAKLGKKFDAAVFVVDPCIPITGVKFPKTKDEMYADPAFKFRHVVRIPPRTGSRVMALRPMIGTGWTLSFSIEFDESVLNVKDIIKAQVDAGSLVGLGDWRPKFGRFVVE